MCEPELLALTESEPLSLEEEQENQLSWLCAEDKLTFILLAPISNTEHKQCCLLQTVPYPKAAGADCSSAAPRGSGACPWTDDGADLFATKEGGRGKGCRCGGERAECQCQCSCCRTATRWVRPGELEEPDSAVAPPRRFVPSSVRHAWSGADVFPPSEKGTRGDREKDPVPRSTGNAFIVSSPADETQPPLGLPLRSPPVSALAMVGDCNLFLLPNSDEDEDEERDEESDEGKGGREESPVQVPCSRRREKKRRFEIEVMVAETTFRRRGLAKEAIRLLMCYAVEVLGATGFVAKILDSNEASIRLFQDAFGFREFKRVPVFHEVHLLRDVVDTHRGGTQQALGLELWREECQAVLGEHVIVGPYTKERHDEIPVVALVSSE